MKQATIRDIQKATGLSLSTISKYLNGGHVLNENKVKIDSSIKELNFTVNQFGRNLKTNTSKTIGVLIPFLTSYFTTSIVEIIEDTLRQNGYGTIICNCRDDTRYEAECLRFMIEKRVDGIFTVPCNQSGEHLKAARAASIPVILLDQLTTRFETDAVLINNREITRQCVREFVKLGHRRIGFINGPDKYYTFRERMAGYLEALDEAGIERDGALAVIEGMSIEGGQTGTRRLLHLDNPPTALLCANYEISLGAIKEINAAGIIIGSALSMICFDLNGLADVFKPRLTVVSQPVADIAKEAAELMLGRLKDEGTSSKTNIVSFPAELVDGDSVCAAVRF